MSWQLHIGALAPPLREQLAAQGFDAAPIELKHAQRDVDALVRLRVRGILTSAEAKKGEARAVKRLAPFVEPTNGDPSEPA